MSARARAVRMRAWFVVGAVAGVGAAVLVGCVALRAQFQCDRDEACTLGGRAGFCEADGLCSVGDAACPSGRRYSDGAGALAGTCTTAVDLSLPPADLASDDAAPPNQCPAFALFCSGFESGLDGFTNQLLGGNTHYEVTSDRPLHGAHSLHAAGGINLVDGGGTASEAAGIGRGLGSDGNGTVAVRAYYYVPSALGSYAELLWIAGSGLGGVGSTALGAWFINEPAGEHDGTDSVPLGRWFCLEQLVEPGAAGQPSRVRVFVDGVTVLDFASMLTGPVTDAWVGLVRAPGDASAEVWVDDVVVATARIGCE